MLVWAFVFAISLLTFAGATIAGPITFNSALPVSEGVGILRSQVKLVRKSGDATPLNRDLTVTAVPLVLAYGISSRLAVFGMLPYIDKRMDITMGAGRVRRHTQGLLGVLAVVRYLTPHRKHGKRYRR